MYPGMMYPDAVFLDGEAVLAAFGGEGYSGDTDLSAAVPDAELSPVSSRLICHSIVKQKKAGFLFLDLKTGGEWWGCADLARPVGLLQPAGLSRPAGLPRPAGLSRPAGLPRPAGLISGDGIIFFSSKHRPVLQLG
jgi:hypothetical protein